jgi:hypothetical protein
LNFNEPDSVISQKIEIFITTTVRTSNPTSGTKFFKQILENVFIHLCFLSVVILNKKAICPGVLNYQDLIGFISQALQVTVYLKKNTIFTNKINTSFLWETANLNTELKKILVV